MSPKKIVLSDGNREALGIRWQRILILGLIDFFKGSEDFNKIIVKEIDEMLKHLKAHPKDNHSRRGLLKMVIKRKKLMKYLERTDKKRYNSVIRKAGLKAKK